MSPAAGAINARTAARRYLLLTVTRWLPVGLTMGLTVLLPVERGISLAQLGSLLAIQGLVVLALEIPCGGLADHFGRRPLLVIAGLLAVASSLIFLLATDYWGFALALLLQGLFRALDSGPLESWYVDAATAEDPDFPIERVLSHAATALGLSIAGGALIGGALVAWHPWGWTSAFTLPFVVSTAAAAAHVVLLAALVREPRRRGELAASGTGDSPQQAGGWSALWRTTAGGLGVLRTSRVLRGLVMVEVFWALAMLGFETLMPLRLAELLGGEGPAGVVIGPASAVAWGLFALGSAVIGLLSRRWGVARTAIAARILNGAMVIGMGLAAGPVGLLIGFGLAYATHGGAGPLHNALLHRCATAENRTLVLSLNSLVASGVYSLAMLAVLPLAGLWGTGATLVLLGALSMLGALGYLGAWKAERATRNAELIGASGRP